MLGLKNVFTLAGTEQYLYQESHKHKMFPRIDHGIRSRRFACSKGIRLNLPFFSLNVLFVTPITFPQRENDIIEVGWF